ncbi:hypothetical protein BAE44_0016471 [Dichanthelium oligosanthes]|uniref:Uncharacterized protein n=1 Tax=Dichanthelium oligosanthes TaxID=888268 RepID=A0A1E5VBH9_9POAL|nr:hypothetical protein BAE44_0016471 [Dichanthelium oligosanthes]
MRRRATSVRLRAAVVADAAPRWMQLQRRDREEGLLGERVWERGTTTRRRRWTGGCGSRSPEIVRREPASPESWPDVRHLGHEGGAAGVGPPAPLNRLAGRR